MTKEDHDFTITEITTAHVMCFDPPFADKTENRLRCGLFCVVDGEPNFMYQDAEFKAQKDCVIFLNKDSTYSHFSLTNKENNEKVVYEIVNFEAEFPFDLPDVMCIEKRKDLALLIEKICREWILQQNMYRVNCKIALYQIIAELMWHHTAHSFGSKKRAGLSPALQHMNQFYQTNITVKQLAQLCNMSPTHFRREFKHDKGISPMRYLNNLRIEKAKVLLKARIHKISEIAEMTGFSNVYHFSNRFKELMGMSPSKY